MQGTDFADNTFHGNGAKDLSFKTPLPFSFVEQLSFSGHLNIKFCPQQLFFRMLLHHQLIITGIVRYIILQRSLILYVPLKLSYFFTFLPQ